MPKPRKNSKDNWMPPRVYRGKSAYEYRPPLGGAIRLCKLDEPNENVWLKYKEAKDLSLEKNTIAILAENFINSLQFRERKMTTQKDYRSCSKRIIEVFGEMNPNKVKIQHVREFMDFRGEEIKRFREIPRTRYIDDYEYQTIYDLAPLNVQAAMEISYLCAARQRDVLNLTLSDIREQGLYIEQGKTGKKQIKEWTNRLRGAIDLAIEQPTTIKTKIIIHTKYGQAYTSSGFKALFGRVKDKAFGRCPIRKGESKEHYKSRKKEFMSLYPGVLQCSNFTFHDLKGKGISDYIGDKQKFSGHKSREQMEKYNRKIEVVKIVDHDKE